MKGLLHSKRFRNNLKRWLLAYVGVLVLLTTVVTYSKYISSLNSKDLARPAKFQVSFENNTVCNQEKQEKCVTKSYYPDSLVDYNFSIDMRGTEVKTIMIVTIYFQKEFDMTTFKINNTPVTDYEIVLKDNQKIIKLKDIVLPNNGTLNEYLLTLQAHDQNSKILTHNIHVDYSIKQLIGEEVL